MTPETLVKTAEMAHQTSAFLSGNEAAAFAASQVDYHVMGYYPITPSTEVAEKLAEMKAEGRHGILMVPAEGEHGAAGICYGAATGGGRVMNATSSQGLLYALEQLPVQSGTRFPMVLNVATRAISGPLDIRGDHSDLYFALNTGWIILLARDPQAVYDLNLLAVGIGEHPEVRLPVIVAYDGFFTSHQKRRLTVFEKAEDVRDWIGPVNPPFHALDPEHPLTIGPYMNDPDLINNKYQLKRAFEAAERVIPAAFEHFRRWTGRSYQSVSAYRLDDAEGALVLLNSAAQTAEEAADRQREKGRKVGVLSLSVLRPFPSGEIREALRSVKGVVVGDRADSYGAGGGNLSLEIKAALQEDTANHSRVLSRIYGLGGKDFLVEDADLLFDLALGASRGEPARSYDYIGVTRGVSTNGNGRCTPKLTVADVTKHHAHVTVDAATKRLDVTLDPMWKMTDMPSRIAPGHSACPGCGAFTALRQFFRVIDGPVVALFQTGCAMVVTTGYPTSAHRVTYIHNLFQNGGATLSGLVEMYHERMRRGELPGGPEITFVMVSGDGGMDIGMGSALGAAHRNHRMIILEYDNQAYMNTGSQLSYATPMGHFTSTSPVGSHAVGKAFHHKDSVQMFAATHIPYVFSAVEGFPEDLMKKAAKAQWYAQHEGFVYGKVLSYCPLNWIAPDDAGASILQTAVDSCFFPLYEVERGKTVITYDPEALGRRRAAKEWLGMMGKTKHLMKAEHQGLVDAFEQEVERRWRRLNAMHKDPDL